MARDLFPAGVIADTVVVNYFTMLGRFPLLTEILGGVVHVPRLVYDPEDAARGDNEPLSELERGLRLHRRRSDDAETAPHLRERSRAALPHFEMLKEHVRAGRLIPLDLSEEELRVYAMLRERQYARQFGRVAALGQGEAAALAIAEARGMRLATDDQDCITVAAGRSPTFEPLRVRGLLLLAVQHRVIELGEAQSIHLSMVQAGFWDTGRL